MFRIRFLIVIAALALTIASGVSAQDMSITYRLSYFAAEDADGIQQVYQLFMDGQSVPRQLTQAEVDVQTFGVAYDSLAIAYISGGALWLQPTHTDSPERLAEVGAEQIFGGPIFSQDGSYIAYPNDGVWLYDLAERSTEQILANVPFDAMGSAAEFRIYTPNVFVPGTDGRAEKLILDVGVWEWQTPGVYDLATGELQLLDGTIHTQLLPLSDGRALLYGNGGVAGEFALHLAESLDDINDYTRVLVFAELTDQTLFADGAVEISPGVVRITGLTLSLTPDVTNGFTFVYDVNNDAVGEIQMLELASGEKNMNTNMWNLSPDGRYLSVYLNALWTETGSIYGGLRLIDLTTGETDDRWFPETVGPFHWQP